MDDVNDQPQATIEPVETPTEQPSQAAEPTATPVVETPAQTEPERTVPISVLQAERKRRQEMARENAELKSKGSLAQYDPEDLDSVMQHPFVQELILKDARRELTDYARDTLSEHSEIPEVVKKAILRNVRGFVNESTTDVETAKIDIQQFIEDTAAEIASSTPAQPAQPKGFPVAPANLPASETGNKANAVDLQKVIDTPVDEWTDEDIAAAEEASQKKS